MTPPAPMNPAPPRPGTPGRAGADVARIESFLSGPLPLDGMTQQLMEAARAGPDGLEVEIRLGRMTPLGFQAGVPEQAFARLLSKLEKSGSLKKTTINTTQSCYANGMRCEDGRGARKEKLFLVDAPGRPGAESDLRFAVNRERPCVVPKAAKKERTRCKERTSFEHKYWRFDLTRVEVTGQKSAAPPSYEVELELLPRGVDFEKLATESYARYVILYGLMMYCDLLEMARPTR